ncbi:uncharacterized protein NECHADRAFT_87094 [Fusarium vanettenii 77-13-4]|uniref:F-box domain-containing protein n=1 Tax=Fusarium vanettenii (strain ATCC MYA-4622 / CBS 123669 / FGSC 9596 / NRRL 45880 / 77-13-4) TaxID=660122 RepID=C7ZIC4_FUSV7|nr:uncharacterized protein NECHADRAFT_87094 [Fusarium vanettenii 77-13-4]EEU36180.1 predicted protein [Fusarium vanettenii 77-13-4]
MADPIFAPLPPELIIKILGYLSAISKSTLLNLRLVDQRTCSLATPVAFQSLFLGPNEGSPHHRALPKLRCPSSSPNLQNADRHSRTQARVSFLSALPLIRCLPNLKSLRLCFTTEMELEGFPWVEELLDYRTKVLQTIFKTLAGDWSAIEAPIIRQELETGEHPACVPDWGVRDEADQPTGPTRLDRLTLHNVPDDAWSWTAGSEHVKMAIASGSLVDLRLSIATEGPDWNTAMHGISEELHVSFNTLTSTWLSRSVAQNLKILSLSCPGGGGGFPNLKVLALKKYVFSHQWQIDWFASLGLEELELDTCAIIYEAKGHIRLSEGTTIVGQDNDGVSIKVSNKDYPIKNWMNSLQRGPVPNHLFPIRWHNILSEWRQSMTTLKSFQITAGELYARHESGLGMSFAEAHRQEHEDFRRKLFPQPSGVKVSQDHGFYYKQPLRYLYFDDMEFWNEWNSWDRSRSEDEGRGVEDGVEARDKAALLDFLETIRQRNLANP